MKMKVNQNIQTAKSKNLWKVISLTIGLIAIIVSIVMVGVNWDEITSYFNNNQFLTGTMLASLGVNALSLGNILFGIILKIIQSRIEKNKNDTTKRYIEMVLSLSNILSRSDISPNNKEKMLMEEIKKFNKGDE